MIKVVLVSACLFGENCKYNGGNNFNSLLKQLLKDQEVLLICPEQLGGLPTPRTPAEIQEGEGKDVLAGKSWVINKNGDNITNNFIKGAKLTLAKAKIENISLAILKSNSPSCGVNKIYDGSFSAQLKKGDGVTTALLRDNNISVISDEDFIKGENTNESN